MTEKKWRRWIMDPRDRPASALARKQLYSLFICLIILGVITLLLPRSVFEQADVRLVIDRVSSLLPRLVEERDFLNRLSPLRGNRYVICFALSGVVTLIWIVVTARKFIGTCREKGYPLTRDPLSALLSMTLLCLAMFAPMPHALPTSERWESEAGVLVLLAFAWNAVGWMCVLALFQILSALVIKTKKFGTLFVNEDDPPQDQG